MVLGTTKCGILGGKREKERKTMKDAVRNRSQISIVIIGR